MTKDKFKKLLLDILNGIDKTEIDDEDGWWETSSGVEFGQNILYRVIKLIDSIDTFTLKFDKDKALSGKVIVKTKSGKIVTQLTEFKLNDNRIILAGVVDNEDYLTWSENGERVIGTHSELDLVIE
jgi:isocitrate/isopropylmalate dehydrogenase